MDRIIEIRQPDRNTVILWVSIGQNIFAFKNGSCKSRRLYSEVIDFSCGARRFENILNLYNWALEFMGYDICPN